MAVANVTILSSCAQSTAENNSNSIQSISSIEKSKEGEENKGDISAEKDNSIKDDSLNEIYSVIKNKLHYDEMKRLEKEELEWINYKANNAKKCVDEFKGGTAESLIYTSRLAELTKERCYYLVNEFM